ncbi:nucleotide 5'-monophosphate nucleosidase PpnN [Methylococcus capsulatus]|uniref:nucleotide 5'-monophosphate nucleosidase PpnN n=1 Tax=Methylococcus capsulatus TaxID=414 RepID=UPI0024B52926|nr:nucleotide 5'-monophosphate nucleosidase PpnN [Methylococcus capsulatus]
MSAMNVQVSPEGSLEVLSKLEVGKLLDSSESALHELFRNCSLAVLNCGGQVDDSRAVFDKYRNFDIRVLPTARGVRLELIDPPPSAFVDGEMIRGIREHLFSVLRDIVYTRFEIVGDPKFDLSQSRHITDAVFHILRNANCLIPDVPPNMVVCWGGHSIDRGEYEYTKEVGHELGLRGLDVCTGCGPGAMKGPMKGATIAHAKQRIRSPRYVGISEPGIIAAEPPNPIVNELVIMPDIEKRLEAFVRTGHGIVVFPGGVGTAEEVLHLLGILLHPENKYLPFPLVFTGPRHSAGYFEQIDRFIGATLGQEARKRYQIVIGDPAQVARRMKEGIDLVRQFRRHHDDAYYYNWLLHLEPAFQTPFMPSHENMAGLALHRNQPPHALAANLRRAFSGIVAGNVKADGIRRIEQEGPFEIRGDRSILDPLDELLATFVAQKRMKLPGTKYEPCYRLVA